MNDIILTYIHSKIKPTLVPLYRNAIAYLSDINYSEILEDIENLIQESASGHITNDTIELESILRRHLLEVSSILGIVFDNSRFKVRVCYDILTTLETIPDMGTHDLLYISDIIDNDDMSNLYKFINIIARHNTWYDEISLNEYIDDITTTLLENIKIMTIVELSDNSINSLISSLLSILINIDNKQITLGATILNDTNEIDTKGVDLIKIYWDRINDDYIANDIYSLLVLGRDSRLDVMGYYREYVEELIPDSRVKKVTNNITLLNIKYKEELKKMFDDVL